jgi:teichoic acid transport system ATP-binding protein
VTDPTVVSGIGRRLTNLDDIGIRVEHASVRYKVFEEARMSARELVGRGFRSRRSIMVNALRDVTFDIGVGEAVGIVGSNGSGKSTLLRAIAGLQPTFEGHVLTRGEPHLLGVSAALQPLLSGYRNILLGCLAMGLTRDEAEDSIEGIREFSGLGDALGRPMQSYSSGMRARLAFSIATMRTPDILLIDEALAVGDKQFRARSLERVRQIREDAGTVVMVTHNLGEIRQTCSRAIWLHEGSLRADGDTSDVLGLYEAG